METNMAPNTKQVNDILIKLSSIETKLETIESSIKRTDKFLFTGNGQKSVMARLENNEVQLEELKWIKRVIFGTVITTIITAIGVVSSIS